ncbi:uncharacterized protein METZ01_LOCUS156382, partial [marine metagenome]
MPFSQFSGEMASAVCKVNGSSNRYSRFLWLTICTSERLSSKDTFLRESISTVLLESGGVRLLRQ